MVLALERLVILGYGYLGAHLHERARRAGLPVVATSRRPERARELGELGCAAVALSREGAPCPSPAAVAQLRALVDGGAGLVVTFPPDGHTDESLAELAGRAGAAVYVSSTGVYGNTLGTIDDATPPAPDSPRTAERLTAEGHWRERGATVLRVAAIYGPHRGMHARVRDGSARIAGDGSHHICRIHIDDLVSAVWRSLELALGPETFVLADDEPAPQGEVVRYLARALGVPDPASVPLESVSETLRHDRKVDASRFKARTGLAWAHPTYREGFLACLRAEEAEGSRAP